MKFKSFVCFVFTLIFAVISLSVPVSAESSANSYILLSESSVTVGDTFTVTVNVVGNEANIGSVMGNLTYDSGVAKFVSADNANGSDGSVNISAYDASNTDKNMQVSMKFEAVGTGSTYFTFTPSEITDVEENPLSCDGASDNVTVVNEKLSDNADLSALRISAGSLDPSFSSDTTYYEVYVGNSVNELVISADAEEDDASVSISGEDELSVGENKRVITVTAPNGEDVKKYTVVIYRNSSASSTADTSSEESSSEETSETSSDNSSSNSESNKLTAVIGGKTYTVLQSFDEKLLPGGFVKSTQYYNNIECSVAYNEKSDIAMFYLEDENKKCAFYIYDIENKEFYKYTALTSSKLKIILLNKPVTVEIPANFDESVLELKNVAHKAWKLNDSDYNNFYLVYGMTSDGETGLYLYDSEQKTIQKYVRIIEEVQKVEKIGEKQNMYLLIAVIALAVISITLFIIIVVLCRKHREYKF